MSIAALWLLAFATPAMAVDPDSGAGAPIEDAGGSDVPTSAASATTVDELGKLKALEEARKAAFDAAKAAAESRKAAVEAQSAADLSKIGTVTGQSTITGMVTMGTYGAKAEALLLVTRSTRLAAEQIAPLLQPSLDARKDRTILILSGTSDLATPDAIQFDLQVHGLLSVTQLAHASFQQAKAIDTPPIPAKPIDAQGGQDNLRLAPVAAIGAALDIATKIGSYFAADYSFGSVEVSTTPQLVANALVAALRQRSIGNAMILPGNTVAIDARILFADLDAIQNQYLPVLSEQVEAKGRAAELAKATGPKAARAAALYALADAAATRATSAYDKLINGLFADPAEGKEPAAVRIIRQKSIQAQLATDPLILLLNSDEAAAYYTKKTLWSFLGGPPLYAMGGVSLTYTLYENKGGGVLIAGTVGKHGGYRSVRAVEKLFQ